MRLSKVEVSDYRSIFADEKAQPLTLDLGEGLNTLVGINNCGKSNVLRAIALALDANHPFDPRVDNPANRQFAFPVIRLSFEGEEGREKD